MSTQSKTMPMLDLKVYIRVVAAVFSISSTTAFVMALLRLLNPELYYLEPLVGTDVAIHNFIAGLMVVASAVGFLNSCVVVNCAIPSKPLRLRADGPPSTATAIHYFIAGLMVVASAVGFLNSCVVVNRSVTLGGRQLTMWLLLDSFFETSRVVYVFVCEVVLKGRGPLQVYELLVSAAQYLLDSFLYCQMILRH